jgi:hypothetical protein
MIIKCSGMMGGEYGRWWSTTAIVHDINLNNIRFEALCAGVKLLENILYYLFCVTSLTPYLPSLVTLLYIICCPPLSFPSLLCRMAMKNISHAMYFSVLITHIKSTS